MKEFNTLTRAEMQIMNILWDKGCGMTTHEIIDAYPEPHPAYSTIATFMKILTHKQYVTSTSTLVPTAFSARSTSSSFRSTTSMPTSTSV